METYLKDTEPEVRRSAAPLGIKSLPAGPYHTRVIS